MNPYESRRDTMQHSIAWRTDYGDFLSHFHASVELLYMESGAMNVVLDGVELTVRAGECFVASPYMVHSYQGLETRSCLFAIIPLAEVPSLSKALGASRFTHPIVKDEDGSIHMLLEMMVAASERENQTILKGISYALLGVLMERSPLDMKQRNTQSELMRDVLQYIHEHIDQPLSLRVVAATFGYSESRFSHLFGEHLKRSMHDYVRQLRCQQAAQLLRETEMSVSEIALSRGFTSLQTFYRSFRLCYGVTPAAYRSAVTEANQHDVWR